MNIEVIRQKRKTISLRLIDAQHAQVKAPKTMSKSEILQFVRSKCAWLEKHSAQLSEKEVFARSFDFEKYFYLDGKKVAEISLLCPNYLGLSLQARNRVLKKLYLSHFEKLANLTGEIAKRNNLKFSQIRPTNSVRVWGSFNSQKVIKLNWKLVILPDNLARYVICHELAHSVFFNHSKKFWAFVETLCPNAKKQRKNLENYAFLLRGDLNI